MPIGYEALLVSSYNGFLVWVSRPSSAHPHTMHAFTIVCSTPLLLLVLLCMLHNITANASDVSLCCIAHKKKGF